MKIFNRIKKLLLNGKVFIPVYIASISLGLTRLPYVTADRKRHGYEPYDMMDSTVVVIVAGLVGFMVIFAVSTVVSYLIWGIKKPPDIDDDPMTITTVSVTVIICCIAFWFIKNGLY